MDYLKKIKRKRPEEWAEVSRILGLVWRDWKTR